MSEPFPTTTTVPRIIPPHPRFPGGRPHPEDPDRIQKMSRARDAERTVIAKISPDQGSVVLFTEDLADEEEVMEAVSPIESEDRVAIEAAEDQWMDPAEAESSVEAVSKAESPETGEMEPETEAAPVRTSRDLFERDAPKMSTDFETNEEEVEDLSKGALEEEDMGTPKARRKGAKGAPVLAISGEVSPFNDRHPQAKRGLLARLRERDWQRKKENTEAAQRSEEVNTEPAPTLKKEKKAGREKRDKTPELRIEPWVDGESEEPVNLDSSPTVRAADAEAAPKPIRGRRVRRPLLSGRRQLAAMVGLACAVACGMWIFWQYDAEPPADGNLIPVVAKYRNDNAVHKQLSHFLGRFEFDGHLSGMSAWKDYDTDTLAELLRKNGSALELILSCLAEKDWEPQHPAWQLANLGGDLPWGDLARVKQTESLYLQRRGLEVAAFRSAFDLMEFGRKVQGLEAWPNYFLTGLDIYHRGLETVEQLVADTRMNSAQLGALQRTFAAHHPPGEADLVTFYRASYALEKAILNGEPKAPARPGSFAFQMARPDGILFKQNRTLELFADAFGKLIGDAAKPHYLRTPLDFSESETASALDSNRSGRRYFARAMKPYVEIPEKQALSVAHYEAVKTLFALRRHGLDMGRLPDTLADLGENYLKAIPDDPFDGHSLRYDRYKKVVYSMGVDRIDSGGKTGRAGFSNSDEPTLEIPFSTGGDAEFH